MRRLEGFGGEVVLGGQMDQLAVERMERAVKSVAQPHGAAHDRVEDRLRVCWRAADEAKDLGRGRQALLQIADPGTVVLGRPTGNRGLGFLGLRGLWIPAHRPPLASYDSARARLGEPVSQGKGTANRP